ncbi:MAG: hypothetical protein ABFD98_00265 [Syntrophobacteraceae bacterium]|nr:hypothetical protein [Desulfobacteraceae bacterium]
MAEIKSTLDLVMERTRNLTLSDEEKRGHAEAEFIARVKGMICRYEDGVLTVERFAGELTRLMAEFRITDGSAVLGQFARRLDPHRDNAGTFALLEALAGVMTRRLQTLFERYAESVEEIETQARRRRLSFLECRGISGPAVIADIAGDAECVEETKRARIAFEREADAWASEAGGELAAQ